jgi:hypothetical protein
MLIETHGDVEGFFDGRDRAFQLHVARITRTAQHGKAVRFRKSNEGVVVFLAGTKPLSEFSGREEATVGRTGWIVEFLDEILELGLMAQRQNDVDVEGLVER